MVSLKQEIWLGLIRPSKSIEKFIRIVVFVCCIKYLTVSPDRVTFFYEASKLKQCTMAVCGGLKIVIYFFLSPFNIWARFGIPVS